MKTAAVAFGLAISVNAAPSVPLQKGECCSSIGAFGVPGSVSEGFFGNVKQLRDGQLRIGQTNLRDDSKFCIDRLTFALKDGNGFGCLLAGEDEEQFQCDHGKPGYHGWNIGCEGILTFRGSARWSMCPTGDHDGYNVYPKPLPYQDGCIEITLVAEQCHSSCDTPTPHGSPVSIPHHAPNSPPIVPYNVSTGPDTLTGPESPSVPEDPSGSHNSTRPDTPTGPEAPSRPHNSTISDTPTGLHNSTGPEAPSGLHNSTEPDSPTGPEDPSGLQNSTTLDTPTGPHNTTEPDTPTGPEAPSGLHNSTGPNSPDDARRGSYNTTTGPDALNRPTITIVPNTPTAPHNSTDPDTPTGPNTLNTPNKPKCDKPGCVCDHPGDCNLPGCPHCRSTCPDELTGSWQFPHLIIPVYSNKPDETPGTSFFGTVSKSIKTYFNFDIPASYKGKQCTVKFMFPQLDQLETSSFTLTGSGNVTAGWTHAATEKTSWNNAPESTKNDSFRFQPGNSYVLARSECKAGGVVGFVIEGVENTWFKWFQDSNPCPIGLYITAE